MTHFKKGFLPGLAVVLATVTLSLPAQAQTLAPAAAGVSSDETRIPTDVTIPGNVYRQQRANERELYRGGVKDLIIADRLERERLKQAEIQARQDAIEQQVQDTLAQPSDYGARLEALRLPPPSGMVNPDGTPYVPSAGTPTPTGTQPLPTPIYQNPIAPVGRDPGGIAPAIQ